jgi:hypothetical protein
MIKASQAKMASNEWQNCEGEVGRLVHHLRWRRRAARVRGAVLLAILAVVTVGGNFYYSDVATVLSVRATGSPCDHFDQELRAFYCDKSLSELDQAFWVHLAKCPDCQREFRFFGGIADHRIAHLARHNQRTQLDTTSHHISLDELLKQATFAARQ